MCQRATCASVFCVAACMTHRTRRERERQEPPSFTLTLSISLSVWLPYLLCAVVSVIRFKRSASFRTRFSRPENALKSRTTLGLRRFNHKRAPLNRKKTTTTTKTAQTSGPVGRVSAACHVSRCVVKHCNVSCVCTSFSGSGLDMQTYSFSTFRRTHDNEERFTSATLCHSTWHRRRDTTENA